MERAYTLTAIAITTLLGDDLSEDPIGLGGGSNLYAYANNNPIQLRDPFGDNPGAGDQTAQILQATLGPDPDAVGPHTTWKEDPVTGAKTRTETWTPNPQNPSGWDSDKATDVTGKPHFDKSTGQYIPTPHTHLPDGTVRPATPGEIPKP